MRAALGVGVAVGSYGLTFGAAAATAGLSVPQSCALSLLMFTGASQFALVGVLGSGGSVVAGVLGAVLLGTRNALYAVRLAQLLPLHGLRRLLAAHLTIDETTATTTAAPRELAPLAFWTTGVSLYLLWNATTLLGAAGAARLGDPRRLGLDAAVPAAFFALLWPRLRVARPRGSAGGSTGPRGVRRTALAGGLLAAAAVPVSPVGVPVLVAALAVLPLLLSRRDTPSGGAP